MKACITASYTSCCFCDKPDLPPGTPFSTEPRFNFRKAASRYMRKHKLTLISWGKHKTACVLSPATCQHGQRFVRLDWTLYNNGM